MSRNKPIDLRLCYSTYNIAGCIEWRFRENAALLKIGDWFGISKGLKKLNRFPNTASYVIQLKFKS